MQDEKVEAIKTISYSQKLYLQSMFSLSQIDKSIIIIKTRQKNNGWKIKLLTKLILVSVEKGSCN